MGGYGGGGFLVRWDGWDVALLSDHFYILLWIDAVVLPICMGLSTVFFLDARGNRYEDMIYVRACCRRFAEY